MKTLIIIAMLLTAVTASANDWEALQNDLHRLTGAEPQPQSSLSERYDQPSGYVEQDTTPMMQYDTRQCQGSLTDD